MTLITDRRVGVHSASSTLPESKTIRAQSTFSRAESGTRVPLLIGSSHWFDRLRRFWMACVDADADTDTPRKKHHPQPCGGYMEAAVMRREIYRL
jgi:hypothetical protein